MGEIGHQHLQWFLWLKVLCIIIIIIIIIIIEIKKKINK